MRKLGAASAIMGSVTTTPATYSQALRSVKRPDPVAVGTIVWLGSEVMFFAGLFATEDRTIGMTSFIENGPGKAKFTGK